MKRKINKLLKEYKGKRDKVTREMCEIAGTIDYYYKYCLTDDKKFNSCMRDTIEVLNIMLKQRAV